MTGACGAEALPFVAENAFVSLRFVAHPGFVAFATGCSTESSALGLD
jgi:hypothetical protein